MTVPQAIALGVTANTLSKKVAGTSKVSLGRSAVAVGTGGALGAVASGAVVVGAAAFGVAASPIVLPLTAASALVAGIASVFE